MGLTWMRVMVEVGQGEVRQATHSQEIIMPLWINRDRDKIATMGKPAKTHESGFTVHSPDPMTPPKMLVDLFTDIKAVMNDFERESARSHSHLTRVK